MSNMKMRSERIKGKLEIAMVDGFEVRLGV